MIIDQYANYFVPKLFQNICYNDKLRLLMKLKPCMVQIAMSKVGTYPLQIIIETVKSKDEKLILIEAFKNDILDICYVYLILYY